MDDIKKDPFEEYIKNLPPTRKEMGDAWSAAIGLQDVDGLKPSEYLYETARKNIDGEIKEGQYLVLGDSRETALDSRTFGPISGNSIKGKVFTIIRRRPL